MKKHHIILTLLTALIFLLSCEGKQGATGPAGPKGDKGDRGVARTIYFGDYPIPTLNTYCVDVPEITLNDMPMVSVLVAHSDVPELWWELPSYFEDYPDFGPFACYTEGQVCFRYCKDFLYMIIILE